YVSALAYPGRLRSLQAADRRRLGTTLGRCESDLICNVGDRIAVSVDLDLVECIGCEGLRGSRSPLDHVERRVHVHDECRLAGISRLGKSKQIRVVETGVPTGKRELRTRIVV